MQIELGRRLIGVDGMVMGDESEENEEVAQSEENLESEEGEASEGDEEGEYGDYSIWIRSIRDLGGLYVYRNLELDTVRFGMILWP